ncbi:hypothetical protein DPMN_184673 [Dreissena polymorpha]|uniref:Uncharacterized protein n=1 Tax=Dreissena polymorpha TaxID=45954 RepID=A0A9D4DKT4_DREPO|nr:hypothetical protein DPMN_184673 [Dreissena polymorpha]
MFKHVQYIIGTNLLTKFHEDHKINVDSRVLTRENVPTPGGYVFQATVTIFELVQDIIKTNLLTKLHKDRTMHVAYRVLTKQMLRPHDAQHTAEKGNHKCSP